MRVGTVCYATRQGIGVIAKNFYDAGLVTDVMTFRHSKYPAVGDWYPPGTIELVGRPFNGPAVDRWLEPLDWVLFVETPFDWGFPQYCRDRGKKTAIVPMYEWWPRNPPHQFDRIIAPSLLDRDLIPGSVYCPIPLQERKWVQRSRARRFLHNAGHVGCDEHKGTRQILEAVHHLRNPLDLTVRVQPEAATEFVRVLDQTGWTKNYERFSIGHNKEGTLTVRIEEAHHDLYPDDYDVFIMAEKRNGESLPLKEARASGMVVMTTDRYPMNTWLDRDYLIPAKRTYRTRTSGAYLEFDQCEVDPEDIAAKMDAVYDSDVSEESLRGREWARENSWEKLMPAWRNLLS